MIPPYISHIKKNEQGKIEFQSNDEHSLGVAKLARLFAEDFGMGDFAYIMGLLHDKGKEKKEFQNYIRYENGLVESGPEAISKKDENSRSRTKCQVGYNLYPY